MANLASIALILTLSFLLVSTYARQQVPFAEEDTFLRVKENILKLHFYVQDLRIGHPNTTVVEVAKAAITDSSPFSFGSVHVLDDLITAEPDINSRPLGRIQGLTTNSDLSTFGIAMNLNFFFTVGKYAGSTLSILGRNQVMDDSRELPVVGGTGVFRYARGYAIQTSFSMDTTINYAVLEYTIYTTYNANINEPQEFEIAEM